MRPARTGIENSQDNGQEIHSLFPKFPPPARALCQPRNIWVKPGDAPASARPIRAEEERASPKKLAPPHRPCAWLWLEVQHRAACLQIDRHRVLMMHDQPLAVDLTEASGPTQPEIGLLPSVQGSAYPIEAVGECNVIAHRDGEVVNFIVNRALVD